MKKSVRGGRFRCSPGAADTNRVVVGVSKLAVRGTKSSDALEHVAAHQHEEVVECTREWRYDLVPAGALRRREPCGARRVLRTPARGQTVRGDAGACLDRRRAARDGRGLGLSATVPTVRTSPGNAFWKLALRAVG